MPKPDADPFAELPGHVKKLIDDAHNPPEPVALSPYEQLLAQAYDAQAMADTVIREAESAREQHLQRAEVLLKQAAHMKAEEEIREAERAEAARLTGRDAE